MSAVAAILSLDGGPIDDGAQTAVAARLREFGRDRQWDWHAPGEPVALFRALDELTPSDRHARGTASAGDWVLAGDVRLDAREDLARSLGVDAGEALSVSDEQLFALALAIWGADAAERLQGGFAVIAWDRSRRQLHLWRDANGERPLYFCRAARHLLVASRAPVLLDAPGVPREIDVKGLLNFLGAGHAPSRTSLVGIEALERGVHHVFGIDRSHQRRLYWQPPDPWAWTRETIERPVEQFREIFAQVVRDELRLLGAKGGTCSGGLDSTSIAAVAATELARHGEPYRTYTSVPHPDWHEPPSAPRWENDERPYVRALAERHPNIEPTFVAMDGAIFLDCLPELFRDTAAPVRNTSNIPWGLAIRELQRAAGVRIGFVGGAGNGSISLDSEILWDLLRAGRIGALAREVRADPQAIARLARAAALVALPNRRFAPLLFLAEGLVEDRERPGEVFPSLAATRIRFQEIGAAGLGAGYAGLERLDPARDRRIVDFCRRLPPQEFRHGHERRRLIRRAMEGILPDEIRLRTTRGAQAPDLWLHVSRRLDDLRSAVEFIAGDVLCAHLIDIEALRRCLRDWSACDAPAPKALLVRFEGSLAMGLYIRWIRDKLTELPGVRPLRHLVLDAR